MVQQVVPSHVSGWVADAVMPSDSIALRPKRSAIGVADHSGNSAWARAQSTVSAKPPEFSTLAFVSEISVGPDRVPPFVPILDETIDVKGGKSLVSLRPCKEYPRVLPRNRYL
jgi:hypothetical protein